MGTLYWWFTLQNVAKKKNDSKLSIIKELGNVYDSVFFQGNTFQSLYDVVQKSHLHHYAAYATDISNALPFRFQVAKKEYGDVTIGNEVKCVKLENAKKYRLSDILAASSCFPIAFEPINFPRDFKDYSEDDEFAQSNMQTMLMDGGIIDNQGIDYLMEADRQMFVVNDEKIKGIDLAIISDAASSASEDTLNGSNDKKGCSTWLFNIGLTLRLWLLEKLKALTVMKIQWNLGSMLVVLMVLGVFQNFQTIGAVLFWGGMFACVLMFLIIGMLKKLTPDTLEKNSQFDIPTNLIWKIDFNQYFRIVSKRYKSFSKVVSTVMMGHIRKKNIEMLTLNSRWTNRFVIPCISSLTSNGAWKKDEKARKMMAGAYELMRISDVASNFHSTLWFSKDDLDKGIPKQILACGQFSICYELYMWVDSHNGRQANMQGVLSRISKDLKGTLKEDWRNFKENPYMLVDLNNLN